MEQTVIIYPLLLVAIFCQCTLASPFLLKCETIADEAPNATRIPELTSAMAVEDDAVINTFDDYNITSIGAYKIHKSAESWNDARNICLDERAQLVVINSAAEEALLIKYMKDHNIAAMWIGVHDLFQRNQWTTVTGERLYSLDYVHWKKGEPNNVGSNENCVHISQTGMNDIKCSSQLYFVCEKMKLML